MNQREKILAASVGALILLGVAYFGYSYVGNAFTVQRNKLENVTRQVDQRQFTVDLGLEASGKLDRYMHRSLPGDANEARSQYEAWLLATTVEFFGKDEAGKSKVDVRPKAFRARDDAFVPIGFTIEGEGNLEQLTQFLHRFYDVDYLHRIQKLSVSPIKDSRNLKINCDVEGLMVIGADEKQKLADIEGDRLKDSLDDYLDVILGRNLFGPPNNPPQIASVRTPTTYEGNSVSETITARDRDPLDSVMFRLEEGPEGMRLESGRGTPGGDFSARLSWRADRKGRYDVVIAAIDDGYPNKESFLEFEINVTDPPRPEGREDPPPKKEFDHSRYTFLTSVQQVNGEGVVWFYIRTKNEKIVCQEGDEVQVGPYTALVKRIDIDTLTVDLEVEDEVLVLKLRQNLHDAQPKETLKVSSTGASRAVAPLD